MVSPLVEVEGGGGEDGGRVGAEVDGLGYNVARTRSAGDYGEMMLRRRKQVSYETTCRVAWIAICACVSRCRRVCQTLEPCELKENSHVCK